MTLWDWITLARNYLRLLAYNPYGDKQVQADYENTLNDLESAMKDSDIIKCVTIIGKTFGTLGE